MLAYRSWTGSVAVAVGRQSQNNLQRWTHHGLHPSNLALYATAAPNKESLIRANEPLFPKKASHPIVTLSIYLETPTALFLRGYPTAPLHV
jgi:hypothetical protein